MSETISKSSPSTMSCQCGASAASASASASNILTTPSSSTSQVYQISSSAIILDKNNITSHHLEELEDEVRGEQDQEKLQLKQISNKMPHLIRSKFKSATLDSNASLQRTTSVTVSSTIGHQLHQHHHPDCSYASIANQLVAAASAAKFKRRGSAKLQPSPSSASSHSNTSSLFKDDGFEDDLISTGSEHLSSSNTNKHQSTLSGITTINNQQQQHLNIINHPHHRLSFQGTRSQINLIQQLANIPSTIRRSNCGSINNSASSSHNDDNDDQQSFQSCEEKLTSNTTTTTTSSSNFDDCALSTTSSSIINQSSTSGSSSAAFIHSRRTEVFDKLTIANVKQQYRKSLLLEHNQYSSLQQQQQLHQQQQHQASQNNLTSRIQSLASPTLSHLHLLKTTSTSAASLSNNHSNNNNSTIPKSQVGKSDDRTVNIIGHMPTKCPGYWDSNLSITQRVVTEIIETERTYVDDLEQIVTGYICYLRNVLKQQKHQQQQHHHLQQQQQASHQDKRSLEPASLSSATTTNSSVTNTEMVNNNNSNNNLNLSTSTVTTDYPDRRRLPFVVNDNRSDDEDEDEDEDEDDDDVDNQAEDNNPSLINISEIRLDEDKKSNNNKSLIKDIKLPRTSTSSTTTINDHNTSTNSNTSSSQLHHHNHHHHQQQPQNGAIITASDIKKLFSNLEDIYKFNKDLLFRLEECYLNPSSVAECFVENAPGFEVYTHYCTMYPQVVTTLTELMANQSSAQLLKERQNELNHCLPLGSYLLKPVQRILKYHILFQSLIKHTTDDETINEKDRLLINEAFSVMTSIACHLNSMKKRHEHAIRVQEVQGLLCGWNGPDLTTLGELILEDTFKLYNRPKSTRHLFLFDNVLLMTKKKRDGSLYYKGHIECSNLMLIEKIHGQPLVFNTVPFDNPKALHAFQAKNLDKKRDWCLQMKEVMIKSFNVEIPVHVKNILMSLTPSGCNQSELTGIGDSTTALKSGKITTPKSAETARLFKAPNYLEKKRVKQQQQDKMKK